MTMFAIHLVRLRGDEGWEEHGDDWRDHVERVAELRGMGGWELHDRLRQREAVQLDGGTFLWPMTKAELLHLYGDAAGLRWTRATEFDTLRKLPDDGRFGLVVVEVY